MDADQFYATFNGSSYNSFDPDVCQLTYVSHVEAITTTSNGSCGASFPLKGLVELPSCPVCLEKLVISVDQIIRPYSRMNQLLASLQQFSAIIPFTTNAYLKLRTPCGYTLTSLPCIIYLHQKVIFHLFYSLDVQSAGMCNHLKCRRTANVLIAT